MKKINFSGLLFIFFLSSGLAACKDGVSVKPDANQNAPQEHQQKKRGKPSASVSLENSEPFYMDVPGIVTLDLRLITALSTGTMEVVASAGEGLELLSGDLHKFSLAPDATYTLPLRFSAKEAGRFYINLAISIENAGARENRSISAIVQVGPPLAQGLRKAAPQMQDEVETDVIDMPAQESVRPSE